MKKFLKSVALAAERYRELPNKVIDTNVILLALVTNFLVVGGTVLFAKSSITDACLIPALESQQNYDDPDIRPSNRRL
jgi:hypothetical protein